MTSRIGSVRSPLSILATAVIATSASTLPDREQGFARLFSDACLATPLDLSSVTSRLSSTTHREIPSRFVEADTHDARPRKWTVDTAAGPFDVDAADYAGPDGTMRTCAVSGYGRVDRLGPAVTAVLGSSPMFDVKNRQAMVWQSGTRTVTMAVGAGPEGTSLRVVDTVRKQPKH